MVLGVCPQPGQGSERTLGEGTEETGEERFLERATPYSESLWGNERRHLSYLKPGGVLMGVPLRELGNECVP